ncbi:MAG: 1,4-dihydroxy-2-naphthoate octaprenyltransferase, partial [Chloroflexota bacterium]
MIEQNRLTKTQIWILAARPKTLPAAAASVILGSALALKDSNFSFWPALAALCISILLQIGANFANDLFDNQRGADTSQRLGPTRVAQAGLLSPRQIKTGMIVVFAISIALGAYLAWVAGWVVSIIGLSAIFAALAYTGGPFPFGYHSLGDLFVLIYFGLVAVCGTYFVQTHTIGIPVVWAGFGIGLLITNILVVNNLRDIETDRSA